VSLLRQCSTRCVSQFDHLHLVPLFVCHGHAVFCLLCLNSGEMANSITCENSFTGWWTVCAKCTFRMCRRLHSNVIMWKLS